MSRSKNEIITLNDMLQPDYVFSDNAYIQVVFIVAITRFRHLHDGLTPNELQIKRSLKKFGNARHIHTIKQYYREVYGGPVQRRLFGIIKTRKVIPVNHLQKFNEMCNVLNEYDRVMQSLSETEKMQAHESFKMQLNKIRINRKDV